MIEAFIKIYSWGFFAGVGLGYLFMPQFLRTTVSAVTVMPFLGIGLTTIVSILFVYFDRGLQEALIPTFLFSASVNIVALIQFKKKREGFYSNSNRKELIPTAISFILFAIFLTLGHRENGMTTTFRVGVDAFGYSGLAHSLHIGQTRSQIGERLKEKTGEVDLGKAIKKVDDLLSFDQFISASFLIGAVRWGFSATSATLTFLADFKHTYETHFFILVFSMVALYGVCFGFLKNLLSFSNFYAALGAAAIALNCNLLNTTFEGQWGQTYCLPFFSVIFGCLFNLRNNRLVLSREEMRRNVLAIAFSIAIILPTFGEFILISIFIFGLIFVWDLLFQKTFDLKMHVPVVVGVILGLVFILPYSILWILNLPTRFGDVHIAGWPQPFWATPAEILGLTDMYVFSELTQFQERNFLQSFFPGIFTALVVGIVFALLRKKKILDAPFWLGIVSFVFLILVKVKFLDKIHSYQYMKAYCATLPLLQMLFFISLTFVTLHFQKKFHLIKYLFVATQLTIILTGLFSINRYHRTSDFIPRSWFDLASYSKNFDFENTLVIQARENIINRDMGLSSIIPYNWVARKGLWDVDQIKNKRVVIFAEKNIPLYEDLIDRNKDHIIFSTTDFALIDTNQDVSAMPNSTGRGADIVDFFVRAWISK